MVGCLCMLFYEVLSSEVSLQIDLTNKYLSEFTIDCCPLYKVFKKVFVLIHQRIIEFVFIHSINQ